MTPRPRRLKLLRWIPNAWLMTVGPTDGNSLYLSFDDGPNPDHTPALLDLLARHDAKASFFLIGKQVEKHPQLARRIAQAGHTLGNHSYMHRCFDALPLDEQFDEIERTDRLLSEIDGHARHSFRPPRGVIALPMLMRCIRERRRISYWSYDSMDYSQQPTGQLLSLIQQHPLRNGDIVLMHDDNGLAVNLLDTLLPAWKAQGFELRALPPEA
jgi:peptidoglycan/xylan/chitin deacetylase (PgdA/CDA1 family)